MFDQTLLDVYDLNVRVCSEVEIFQVAVEDVDLLEVG